VSGVLARLVLIGAVPRDDEDLRAPPGLEKSHRRRSLKKPDGIPFRLKDQAGKTADPHIFNTAVPNWRPGDVIPPPHRSLRVVEVRDDAAEISRCPRHREPPTPAARLERESGSLDIPSP
jgi:hypothetical protein